MDFSVLNRGEKIAGVAGILLILIMFIFDWFGLKFTRERSGSVSPLRVAAMRGAPTASPTSCCSSPHWPRSRSP